MLFLTKYDHGLPHSTLKNKLFSKRLKINKNAAKIEEAFWISGWGELFSKWEKWFPGQRGPKTSCVPLMKTY